MITIKEEFLRDPKLRRAIELGGHETVTLWLLLKGYVAENATDGFIPDEELEGLAGVLVKRPRKVIVGLVDCGKMQRNGSRGAGLVDRIELGWQLHNYVDHANTQTDEDIRKEKARIKKAAQRAAKLAELTKLREQLDVMSRGQSRGHKGDTQGDSPGDTDGGQSRGHSGARGGAPGRARAAARSQPSPAQP